MHFIRQVNAEQEVVQLAATEPKVDILKPLLRCLL